MSTYEARPFSMSINSEQNNPINKEIADLIINQNSMLDENFLSRPPPPMPPMRQDSYMLGRSMDEMNGVKIQQVHRDENGKISCV